ncbi:MAG: HD domain-containing protein [Nitrospirae bacterium]|nr:MAG: HD domain-containing protein [Nitrospirota bacterium]
MHEIYLKLKSRAEEFARKIETPEFYRRFQKEIALSRESLQRNNLLRQCINHFCLEQEGLGHGYQHCLSVAIDAGAIVIIETSSRPKQFEGSLEEMVTSVHIAGLLHDIKRDEENHAIAGAREAERVLDCFGIEERFKEYIIVAIRNHEAFKKEIPVHDKTGQLISDALYDADKFRWGIDNFTTTVWDMLSYSEVSPEEFYENYKKGMDYIERIKNTFRTPTGKRYGPEIIDAGLKVGRLIYEELKKELS